MITTCTKCTGLYEAGSEEQANEPVRLCFTCRKSPPSPPPSPPRATMCPSCSSVEATAVCRWCGCWKFSAQAVDAAFRNILAGKF